ncbi:MAG: immunoglobulin domain-containing protein, partial [Limisphaerales bacterium]
TLIVCREMPGGDVNFYDISTPPNPFPNPVTNPVPFVTISPASMGLEDDIPHNPVIISNLLFLSWYQNGLQIFDISDRTRPIRIGSYDTFPGVKSSSYQGNWGIYPQLGLNKLLVSDIQSGLFILDASAVLTATNNYPPLLVKPPMSLTVTQGMNATFSSIVTGSLLKYQWRFNGINIPAGTNSNLSFSSVQPGDSGNYNLIATNSVGAVTSVLATLSVVVTSNSFPAITSQPQSISVYPNNSASFSVAVTGAAPLSYQWYFRGSSILAATNSIFTRPAVQPQEVGSYFVQVSNSSGTITSANAFLTLLDSPYLSAVQAVAGARGALISWNSTIASDSQVQFDFASQSGSLGNSSYIDRTLTTNHVILLSGLSPDTTYSYQVFSTAGSNTYLSGVYQFTTAGSLILDNTNNQVAFSGSWTTGTLSPDKYGNDYSFATTVNGSPNASATFRPNITTPGKYDVYIWYPQGSNRATDAPVLVSFEGGSQTVLVNQTTNGGDWRLIASGKSFPAGTSGFVRLSNNSLVAGKVVIADAVRFAYVESQDFATNGTVPSWWENFYFGAAVDPLADPDSDSYTTAEEYILGTSPVTSSSRFSLEVQAAGNSGNIVFWPYLSNRNYQLLYRTNLTDSSWQMVSAGNIIPTSDGHGIFSISSFNTPQGFYRLAVQWTTNTPFAGRFALAKGSATPDVADAVCGVPNRIYIK